LEKSTFTYLALGLLVWAISGTLVAGYYFTQYSTYYKEYENLAKGFNMLSDALYGLSNGLNDLSSNLENINEVLESLSLRVNILVSYGNGTKIWQNNTALPLGSTAFTAILALADINFTDYGEDLGILVTSIDGVDNNSTHGWFYWYWNAENSVWVLPEYSCTKYVLNRNDIVAFTYESYMTWPPPPPT